VNQQRIDEAVQKALSGQKMFQDQRDIDQAALAEMLACSLQRIEELLTGKPYYDYDRQCWITQ